MTEWLTWVLLRAVPISIALALLGATHWAAFATAGVMLQLLREATVFKRDPSA